MCIESIASNGGLKAGETQDWQALAEDIERCAFHDKHILGIHLYANQDTKNCRIEIKGDGFSATMTFVDIEYFRIYGKAISSKWEYPELPNVGTIAQILNVWLDFKREGKNMHVGIYFRKLAMRVNDLWMYIIRELSVGDISWHVDCLDCLGYEEKYGMENNRHYSVEKLLSCLELDLPIFFARMMAIPGGAFPDRNIDTYEDYRESNCQSVVLCVDGGHFEIYSKDEALLNKLAQYPADLGIEYAEWIDESEEGTVDRTSFIVA